MDSSEGVLHSEDLSECVEQRACCRDHPHPPTWSQVSGRDEANSQYRPVYTAYLTCSFQK